VLSLPCSDAEDHEWIQERFKKLSSRDVDFLEHNPKSSQREFFLVRLIGHNEWLPELASSLFHYVYHRVLTDHDRSIVDMKIEEYPRKNIAAILNIKMDSVSEAGSRIKMKYLFQADLRVDNKLNKFWIKRYLKRYKWRKKLYDRWKAEKRCTKSSKRTT